LTLALALSALAAFLIYLPTLRYDFVWDDQQLVLNNPQLKSGSVRSILAGAFMPGDSVETAAKSKYYRPLVGLSLLIDRKLAGDAPRAFHLHNILLHVAATMLFVLLVSILFQSGWLRLVTGLLFALYPVHSESVAFVSARTDVLMTVFALAAALLGLSYLRRGRPAALVLSGLALLTALLAKETPILLPLAFLPLAARQTAERRRGWLQFGVLLAACAVYVAIRAQVLKGSAPVVNIMNPVQYLLMVINVFGTYAAMLVYPFPQHIFLAQDPRLMQFSWLTLLGIVALALPLVAALRPSRQPPTPNPQPPAPSPQPLLLGWLMFVLAVLPVTNVLSLGLAYAAERLAYLPSVGFLLMACATAAWLLRSRPGRILATGIAAVYVIAMPANLLRRLPVWQDQVSLFRRMTREAPGSASAHNNLGIAFLDDRHQPDSAIAHFRQALQVQPQGADLHANLARALKERRDTLGAIAEYQQAVRLKPGDFENQNNLGQLWGRRGGLDSAISHLELATGLRPNRAEARSNLGIAYAMSGRNLEALAEFREALRLDPGNREAMGNLGTLFYDLDMPDSSRHYLSRARQPRP
jgi:tetratricopeptide (TPR) repeat protein